MSCYKQRIVYLTFSFSFDEEEGKKEKRSIKMHVRKKSALL